MKHTILTFFKKPVVKLAISLLIILALFFWLPFAELWATLQRISLSSWLLVLAGFIGGHLLGTAKWRLLINLRERSLTFLHAVRCYFAGLFSNLFLPSLAGGDIVKTGLAIRYTNKKGEAIFGTLLDRVIDTASTVFIIIIAAFFSPQFLQPRDQKIVYLIAILFILLLLAGLFFVMIPVGRINNTRIKQMVLKAKDIVSLVYKNPVKPLIAFLISLSIQSGFILLNIYLAGICGIYIPVVLWFLIWPLAKLSALLPVSMGGIGVREVALVALLSRLAVPASDAVALGLLWETVLISGSIFGGIIYATSNRFSDVKAPSLMSFSRNKNQIS